MKKKFNFMDILFEQDTDEVEEVEEVEEPVKPFKKVEAEVPQYKQETEKPVVDKTAPLKAEDVMYKKSQTTFIDYINTPVGYHSDNKPEEKKEEEAYEFSTNISPIFGVIEPKKKETVTKAKVVTSQVNKPEDYHLDIVPSPIYGYSSKEDAQKEHYEVNNLEEEVNEDELHRLFETQDSLHVKDEEINLFDSYEEE